MRLLIALLIVGCATTRQAAPNAAVIPEGEGWSCYAASQPAWSGCNRTQEACEKDRAKAQRLYQVDTFDDAKWGRCVLAPQVFCATFESVEPSSGKAEAFFGCFPDEAGCTAWTARPPEGAQRISACAAFR